MLNTQAPAQELDKAKAPSTERRGANRDLGSVLRSAYQETVDEAVPDELLELLGKLG